METSNGVEVQNKLFKYCYLPRRKNITLSEVASTVVHCFLPDHRKHYIQLNFKQSSHSRAYDTHTVPSYLHDRPRHTIIHCLKRKEEGEKLPSCSVTCVDLRTGKFCVKGSGEAVYNISFGSSEEMPSCSCPDFMKYHLLCKHFLAVFHFHDHWKWTSLPSLYLAIPYIMSIDWPVIHHYFVERNHTLSADVHDGQAFLAAAANEVDIENDSRALVITCTEDLECTSPLNYDLESFDMEVLNDSENLVDNEERISSEDGLNQQDELNQQDRLHQQEELDVVSKFDYAELFNFIICSSLVKL